MYGWVGFLLEVVVVVVFSLNHLFKFFSDQIPCPIISTLLNFCAGLFCVYFVWPDDKENKLQTLFSSFQFWVSDYHELEFFCFLIALVKQEFLEHPSCMFTSGTCSLSIWWLCLCVSEYSCPFLEFSTAYTRSSIPMLVWNKRWETTDKKGAGRWRNYWYTGIISILTDSFSVLSLYLDFLYYTLITYSDLLVKENFSNTFSLMLVKNSFKG